MTRAHALDALAGASLALLDKTGTLTTGTPMIDRVHVLGEHTEEDCRRVAAAWASQSLLPLAPFLPVSRACLQAFGEATL